MKKNGILASFLLLLLFLTGLHFILPFLDGSAIPLIVLSGSMHPYMRVGDVVITESVSPQELVVGDVITFHPPEAEEDVFVTHRVVSINSKNSLQFQTKGDANEDIDQFTVPEEDVVGKVVFVIPYLGYLPEASKDRSLFALTVLIPAAILILEEVHNIIKYSDPAKARKAEKNKRKLAKSTSYSMQGRYLFSIACITCIGLLLLLSPYFEGNGKFTLQSTQEMQNPGKLSSVVVLTPENGIQMPSLEYAVISPANSTILHLGQETRVSVSCVPYILPVFWVISLSRLHPLLPEFFIFGFYTLLTLLLTFPLWYRKTVKVKRHTYRRRLYELTRHLNFI